MMGYLILPSPFPLLHRVIQKEIDQNSINLHFRVIPQNLSPDQLHAPDTTTYTSSSLAKHSILLPSLSREKINEDRR